MTYRHAATFAKKQVIEYDALEAITADVAVALRYNPYIGSEEPLDVVIPALLARPDAHQLTAIVIGSWGEPYASSSAGPLNLLVEGAASLPNLRAVFVGEMTSEESEISWIQQSDMSPLLRAYPGLQTLVIRGGEGLAFTPLAEPHALKSLRVETGGLRGTTVEQIAALDLPKLETLELWLGDPNYGGDCTPEQLEQLVAALPPSVTSLALANCDCSREVSAAIAGWEKIDQLQRLDLSMGKLLDDDVRFMLAARSYEHLHLDLSENYLSAEYAQELSTSPNVDARNQREPDAYRDEIYYYVAISE